MVKSNIDIIQEDRLLQNIYEIEINSEIEIDFDINTDICRRIEIYNEIDVDTSSSTR